MDEQITVTKDSNCICFDRWFTNTQSYYGINTLCLQSGDIVITAIGLVTEQDIAVL